MDMLFKSAFYGSRLCSSPPYLFVFGMKQTSCMGFLESNKKLSWSYFTFQYIDGVLSINNSKLCVYVDRLFNSELEIKTAKIHIVLLHNSGTVLLYSVVWWGILPMPLGLAQYLTRQHYMKTVLFGEDNNRQIVPPLPWSRTSSSIFSSSLKSMKASTAAIIYNKKNIGKT